MLSHFPETFRKDTEKKGKRLFLKSSYKTHYSQMQGYETRDCGACGHEATKFHKKLHTIRANYDLWAKRFKEVERGEACISVREWTDKPYRSPQVEITRLTKEHGIGLQKLTFRRVEQQCITGEPRFSGFEPCYPCYDLATNDGLSLVDWLSWFLNYDHTKPMAIIHFTKFRYGSKIK
jgi:hypothetical protein